MSHFSALHLLTNHNHRTTFTLENLTKSIYLQFILTTMKKVVFYFGMVVISIALFTTTSVAQTSATVAATAAGAKLIVPMTLTQTAPLHFGTINILTGAGGTVELPSNSATRVFSAGVVASTVAPVATNAAYNVTGTNSATYALTLPATVVVTATVGTATMTISALTARFNGAVADAVVSTLSATGTDNFTVGGTLTVTAAQAGGVYAGTFPVTVDYN